MTNHPNRSGAISAEMFAEFVTEIRACAPGGVSIDYIRQSIYESALRIALYRATRKFCWADNFQPFIEIESGGDIYNCNGVADGLTASEHDWVSAEVQKIAKHALAALEHSTC